MLHRARIVFQRFGNIIKEKDRSIHRMFTGWSSLITTMRIHGQEQLIRGWVMHSILSPYSHSHHTVFRYFITARKQVLQKASDSFREILSYGIQPNSHHSIEILLSSRRATRLSGMVNRAEQWIRLKRTVRTRSSHFTGRRTETGLSFSSISGRKMLRSGLTLKV